MDQFSCPRIPLPQPLRGNDSSDFTYDSIVRRLVEIAERVLAENEFAPDMVVEIENLINEIPDGQIRLLRDTQDWNEYIRPYLHNNWLDAPWFFVETYFYRRVLEATGYFSSARGRQADPFAHQKLQALASRLKLLRELSDRVSNMLKWDNQRQESLADLLAANLWGNQADLSMWPADEDQPDSHTDSSQQQQSMVVDHRIDVIDYLERQSETQRRLTRIDFILDNAGFELLADLYLALFLLHSSLAKNIVLWAKDHPTFVSDATILDVHQTVDVIAKDKYVSTVSLGGLLQTYLENGRLDLKSHPFWTSPLAMWNMPDAMLQELAQADLIISKGDANYRRLLGDRHWPFTTSFDDVVCYLPALFVAIRTLKSEVVVGLDPGQSERVASQDPDWLTNGQWGMIQFYQPNSD
jgi:uncharacterized protein with ATP-grasp and redox domains